MELDVEAIMENEFYCHLCEEEGVDQELETVYYVEELESYRDDMEKYVAVAEQGCPRPGHVDVDFSIRESFYTEYD